MRSEYVDWLEAQGYNENTCNTQASHIRQIEKYYGELDELISNGKLSWLVQEFTYTVEDERHGRPNPTKVEFNGRTYTRLQSLKGGIKRYARFLEEGFVVDREAVMEPPIVDDAALIPDKQRFALERDMQVALRRDISTLETGLTIVDDGAERSVDSGFIDVLCKDENGQAVVVELKAGQTDARVVAQTLGYMGDLLSEGEFAGVRGIIVAHDFDKRTKAAARAVPNLKLVKYAISFVFERFE